jgi:hypothetical protein
MLSFTTILITQTETATISGRVTDQQGHLVEGAEVVITNVDTNSSAGQASSTDGLYVFSEVKPGRYRISVTKGGFQTIHLTNVVLNVQDSISQNFKLQMGSVSQSITVVADEAKLNTESAAVSTVIDRNFAENMPMNGRSFQTLIQLTPGVVLTPSNAYDSGQFSVNGQRADSNYWMVDGISANIGVGVSGLGYPGSGAGGALGSFSAQGGTNSLVSVDAMQEFRIQTSTYAPEFGRVPGGQISIVTRSGTNQFHGAAFDYFRNDKLDANDWFADNLGLPKPEERQNDFGGTVGGPIWKSRALFFFSYEGLRLRLPQVALTDVPDSHARQNAAPSIQPYLNAFPLPSSSAAPAVDTLGNPIQGAAQFNASFSNQSTLDAYSLRIDHKLNDKLSLFGRYNYSPSEIVQRSASLSAVSPAKIVTQTATLGTTWMLSPSIEDDIRLNYSRVSAQSYSFLDHFGGATPLATLPFPDSYTAQNAFFTFTVFSLAGGTVAQGFAQQNVQRQINLVDNLSIQRGRHSLKFGADFRRLTPVYSPTSYLQDVAFSDVPAASTGSLAFSYVTHDLRAFLLFRNLGMFAQDTWRASSRLILTYGLRWDVDFSPSTTEGPNLLSVTNFSDPSTLAPAPSGTPIFKTPYWNLAPRLGAAYQLPHSQKWPTVVRGGGGVFFDLATQEVGDNFNHTYPFGNSRFCPGDPQCPSNLTFPLNSGAAAPPPISIGQGYTEYAFALNPHLQLPYTLEWNVALEQALGTQQSISVSYVGSAGRRLIQLYDLFFPNPLFVGQTLVNNSGYSSYNAFQAQFQRRLSRGIQALASYTWSHSIDTGSASTRGNASNFLLYGEAPNANRGPSDFDIRHAFSTGLSYQLPDVKMDAFVGSLLHGWSLQTVFQARSAEPVDVYNSGLFSLQATANFRPDVVSGTPFYLYGRQYPGGKAFNPSAFENPPLDASGSPLRQGDLGRNTLRGFGVSQWDLAIHRDFPIRELLKLQVRAEMFNVLNHPNFGAPIGDLASSQFGRSTSMFGQYLNGGILGGNVGGGALSPLYQIGGPRSIQVALKVQF